MKVSALFITALSIAVSAESVDSTEQKIRKNAIDIQPLKLMSGLTINYERLLGEKTGLFLEGSAYLYDPLGSDSHGFGTGVQFRFHRFNNPKQVGLSSPYWGPTLYFEKSSGSAEVATANGFSSSIEKVEFDLTALRVGISTGRRWIYDSGFNIDLRGGYGIFPLYNLSWNDPKKSIAESDKDKVKTLSKVLGGIDFGFSLGFAF